MTNSFLIFSGELCVNCVSVLCQFCVNYHIVEPIQQNFLQGGFIHIIIIIIIIIRHVECESKSDTSNFIYMMITIQKSGAQKRFDHPVYIYIYIYSL